MDQQINKIKSIVTELEIFNIDIRYINNNPPNNFCGVSFSKLNFDFNLLTSLKIIDFFVDPFLSHKTLAIIVENFLYSPNKDITSIIFQVETEGTTSIDTNYNFIMPPYDTPRDFRGEIMMALEEIGIVTISHHHGNIQNQQVINIKEANTVAISKVIYAIHMVAKAYNVTINNVKVM
jgi:glutamine synthetase